MFLPISGSGDGYGFAFIGESASVILSIRDRVIGVDEQVQCCGLTGISYSIEYNDFHGEKRKRISSMLLIVSCV